MIIFLITCFDFRVYQLSYLENEKGHLQVLRQAIRDAGVKEERVALLTRCDLVTPILLNIIASIINYGKYLVYFLF